MPELCRFFGIIITMFYDDHAPPHQDELRHDWTLAEQRAPLKKIKPLE